ncbi:ApxIID [Actinobacillus minor 202]|uniref:Membrane fusion protein (MFP) family protein n=2 Tax=Actinobacillus TaxID=713 RepID=Q5DI87_9PAST|nr:MULTISPECIES: HlyD family type I secretion periplasmic adaptor subunit [Actinobacillus]AAX21417.1 ApxIID [Actinobacillus porcitonsillarum]ACE87885.1 ApxIID [Actinobacillus minor 202]AWI51498.1 HlyD family type I secretion periplasmic adaptor subunit [Actinobacillus porcitonsillarum]
MKLWIISIYEFFLRYKNLFQEVWKVRKELDSPVRLKEEYEFLPAHLELIETPVSKKPRAVAYLIMLFLAISIIISIFSKVEIVATATGKLTFSGRSKEIEPIENALVKEIFVKDGQFVEKGDLLISLSALGVEEELKKSRSSLALARLEKYRYSTLLESIEKEKLPVIDFSHMELDRVSEEERLRIKHLIEEQYTTWQKQKSQKLLAYKRKQAEKQTLLTYIRKYEGLFKIENEKYQDLKKLYNQKSVSRHELLVQENKSIEAKNELDVSHSRLNELEHDLLQVQEEIFLTTQLFKSEILEKLKHHVENEKQLSLELEKNYQRQQASMIRAPISGTIQQLKVHTIGSVVTTAETLMIITPKEDLLEVTALIQNKDIGFIKQGQDAIIKVDTYPYTRYGYLQGKVKHISLDAIEHPQLGLVFNAIIKFNEGTQNLFDEKGIKLGSGMTITAEIKTGMRSIISYLLSPLEEGFTESLRER